MKAQPILPTDAPSIFAQLSTLDRQAIVSPATPPRGIAGFLFDFDAESFLELTSEITDNPLEDNTMVADGIALMPERITVKGMVAELTDAGTSFPTPPPKPTPLPLFPTLFPPMGPGANLSFGTKVGPLNLAGGLTVGLGADGRIRASASASGRLGPFSADAIVRSVNGQLAGVVSGGASLQAAVGASVNAAMKAITGGNAPATSAITAAVSLAARNVLGPAFTPTISKLIGQSVNASVATVAADTPGPASASAGSAYEYYLNRAPVQPGETRQSAAVGYFLEMWRGRMLFSVETPWGLMESMAILNVRPEQPEDTRTGTNFSITFKKVRIAKSVTVNLGQLAGRTPFQAAASTPAQAGNAGQTPATPTQEESWLRNLTGAITAQP